MPKTQCPLCGGEHEQLQFGGVVLVGCPKVPEDHLIPMTLDEAPDVATPELLRDAAEKMKDPNR